MILQRIIFVPNRRFGKSICFHLQGSRIIFWGTDKFSRNVVQALLLYAAQFPRRPQMVIRTWNIERSTAECRRKCDEVEKWEEKVR
jgi:hypothetical protein